VSIAGQVEIEPGRLVEIVGQIDRLAETPHEVLIADFKTGPPKAASDCPQSYVVQLALYAAAVRKLYPGKTVRALLVWTAGPAAVEFTPEQLAAALARVELAASARP
jgi:ATP-dependent helicase/nuclease subunit A